MIKRFWAGSRIAIFVVALLLVACGRARPADDSLIVESESQPADQAVPDIGAPSQQEPAIGGGTNVAEPTAAGEQGGSAPFEFPKNFEATWATLGDHQIETSISFVGQDQSGKPLSFSWQSRESSTTDPAIRRLDIITSGDEGTDEAVATTLIRSGVTGYLYVQEIGCVGGSAGELAADLAPPFDAATLLSGLSGAQAEPGSVIVNGRETTKFQFDDSNLAQFPAGNWSVDGAAYVESAGDLVVRVEILVDGEGDLLGEGRTLSGAFEIIVDVTELKGAGTSLVPDACLGSFLYPTTPDAFDVATIEDLLTYSSRFPFVEVVNFYLAEMPVNGWRLLAEPDVFEDLAILEFEKGGTSLMLTVEYDSESNTTSVLISP